jgi:hypothetical protein
MQMPISLMLVEFELISFHTKNDSIICSQKASIYKKWLNENS